MRACTHGGVEHTDESAQQFWLGEKLSPICLVLRTARDSNLCPWHPLDLEADVLPIEPPRPPTMCDLLWWKEYKVAGTTTRYVEDRDMEKRAPLGSFSSIYWFGFFFFFRIVCHPDNDLRGWLGVKQQLSIYLSYFLCVCSNIFLLLTTQPISIYWNDFKPNYFKWQKPILRL